jgi:hypothetical protein
MLSPCPEALYPCSPTMHATEVTLSTAVVLLVHALFPSACA